jgi:hypothetical protein
MSYPGNPTVSHQHNGDGAIAVGGVGGVIVMGPQGMIMQTNVLGNIPTPIFGENITISGTPAGIRKPQTLRASRK